MMGLMIHLARCSTFVLAATPKVNALAMMNDLLEINRSLAKGAEMNSKDSNDQTLLIAHNADVNVIDKDGQTVLVRARGKALLIGYSKGVRAKKSKQLIAPAGIPTHK